VESVEQLVPMLGCHAGPGVLYGHRDPVAALPDGDSDYAAAPGIPACVVYQDAGQSIDPLGWGADPGRTGTAGGHLDFKVLRGGQRAEPVGASSGDRGQIQRLVPRFGRSGVEPR